MGQLLFAPWPGLTQPSTLKWSVNRVPACLAGGVKAGCVRLCQRSKVSTFIYRHLQGNSGQQRFTIRSGVLTGSDTSGAAQVAADHCPNERTLDPAVCSQTDPPIMPQSAALWPCVGWKVTLCDPIRQVPPRSCEMEFH